MKNQMLTVPLDAANAEDDTANGQNAVSFMAEELGIGDPSRIRPCIAIHFRDGCRKGEKSPGQNPAGHLIAVELRRLNVDENDAIEILHDWDQRNSPPLGDRRLERIVWSAYRKQEPYKYSCENHKLSHTCIGSQSCQFSKKSKGKIPNRKLGGIIMSKGWIWIMSNNAKLIYLMALPILESRKQVGTGGRVYAGHREIATILGWRWHSPVGKHLKELANMGLISYQPGDKCRKNRKASEISRTMPIPDVPIIYQDKIQSNSF